MYNLACAHLEGAHVIPVAGRKREQLVEEAVDDAKRYWFSTCDIAKLAAEGSDKRTKKKFELYELMQAGAVREEVL